MAEPQEEILKEIRRQSSLLEAIEKHQRETNGHLKVIGTLVVIAGSVLALMLIFFSGSMTNSHMSRHQTRQNLRG